MKQKLPAGKGISDKGVSLLLKDTIKGFVIHLL